jgi:hypothetical protein
VSNVNNIETGAELAPTPAVAQPVKVTDARGREITLRKPPVLAQFRFVEALGKSAENQSYLAMTMPLIFIGAIDGVAVPTPNTKGEVEALIQRLDEEGLEALMTGVQEHFAVDPSAEKNSAG